MRPPPRPAPRPTRPAARGGARAAPQARNPQRAAPTRQAVRAAQTARARATATDNRMLTAMSKENSAHARSGLGGNVHGTAQLRGHVFVAGFVALLGAFVTTAGAGSGNGLVGALGAGIAVSAAVYIGFTLVQRRLASLVPGTAHVVSASTPPPAATHGRCEMHLVVQAPRLSATAIRHRDNSVPVAKWPTPGITVPVLVDPRDPRDLRIRWDRVLLHGEAPREPAAPATDARGAETRAAEPTATTTAGTAPAPAGSATTPASTTPATAASGSNGASPPPAETAGTATDGDSGTSSPLNDYFDASDGEPVDLSFLDPPRFDKLVERDPLLVEYGSPVREVGVTLIVSDLKQSLEFYRDVLGFFEIESGPDMVLLEARTGRLVLRQRDDAQPKPPRLMHLTLEVNDIDTAHQTLSKRGVEFLDEPRTVLTGEMLELWAVSFHDPDGHGVALTSWRARAEPDPTQ